jgi:hypothetical protein
VDTSTIALHSLPVLSEWPQNERYPQGVEKRKERGVIGGVEKRKGFKK